MAKRSLRRSLLLGVRIICILLLIGITYHDYLHGGYVALLGDLGFYLVMTCLNYTLWQGQKLAARNISRIPDRDEALPARKAIDN